MFFLSNGIPVSEPTRPKPPLRLEPKTPPHLFGCRYPRYFGRWLDFGEGHFFWRPLGPPPPPKGVFFCPKYKAPYEVLEYSAQIQSRGDFIFGGFTKLQMFCGIRLFVSSHASFLSCYHRREKVWIIFVLVPSSLGEWVPAGLPTSPRRGFKGSQGGGSMPGRGTAAVRPPPGQQAHHRALRPSHRAAEVSPGRGIKVHSLRIITPVWFTAYTPTACPPSPNSPPPPTRAVPSLSRDLLPIGSDLSVGLTCRALFMQKHRRVVVLPHTCPQRHMRREVLHFMHPPPVGHPTPVKTLRLDTPLCTHQPVERPGSNISVTRVPPFKLKPPFNKGLGPDLKSYPS